MVTVNVKTLYGAILDAVADSGPIETDTLRAILPEYLPGIKLVRAQVEYAIADLLASRRLIVNRANKVEVR